MAYFDELPKRQQEYLLRSVAVRFTGTREDLLREVFSVEGDVSELEGRQAENVASGLRWLLKEKGLASIADWDRDRPDWIWVQYGDYRNNIEDLDEIVQGDWDVFGIPRHFLEEVELSLEGEQ